MSTEKEEKNLKLTMDAWREVRKFCAEHDLKMKETASYLIKEAIKRQAESGESPPDDLRKG